MWRQSSNDRNESMIWPWMTLMLLFKILFHDCWLFCVANLCEIYFCKLQALQAKALNTTKREHFSRHLSWSRVMMGRPICWKPRVICLLLPEQSLLWRCWSTWTGSPFEHCYCGCYQACSPPLLNHRGIFQNLVHFLRHWELLNGPGKYSHQVWITTDPNFMPLSLRALL